MTRIEASKSGAAQAELSAQEVVGRQLEAYNNKDIDGFMACWADDAQIFAWPSTLVATGSKEIRSRHLERFREPDLSAELISRTVVEDLVVDREVVRRNLPEGCRLVDVIAIYQIAEGRIRGAWFKQGSPRPSHREAP